MRKILTAGAISILGLMLATGSVFASTNIGNNGNGSINMVINKSKSKTTLSQTNVTTFSNGVTTGTNTGHNHANNNVGGDITVVGGSSSTTTTVTNVAGSNSATDPSVACCCNLLPVGDVTITLNGNGSINKVIQKNVCITNLNQTNVSTISNSVVTSSNTGNNHANGNVGGDVSVTSGDATTTTTISNVAGSNSSN